jgi:hypothetical protein
MGDWFECLAPAGLFLPNERSHYASIAAVLFSVSSRRTVSECCYPLYSEQS